MPAPLYGADDARRCSGNSVSEVLDKFRKNYDRIMSLPQETKEEKEKRKEDELAAVARDIFGRQDFITYVDLAEQIQAILDVKERTAKSYIKFMWEKEIILKDPSNLSYYIIGNLKQLGL